MTGQPTDPRAQNDRIEAAASAMFESDHEGILWADLQGDAFWQDGLTVVRYMSSARVALAAADLVSVPSVREHPEGAQQ